MAGGRAERGTDKAMALRCEEDRLFAWRAGVGGVAWPNLPEAPHRGYGAVPALFSGVLEATRSGATSRATWSA